MSDVKDKAITFAVLAVVVPGVIALALIIGTIDAAAFWLCWNWFVPKILGLPAITLVGAIALTLVVDSIKPFQQIIKEEYKDSKWYSGIVNRLFVLGVAFLVHLAI